jgi:hypothetical protein
VTIQRRRHAETSVGADVITDVRSASGLLYYVLYELPGPWGRIPATSLQGAWDRYKFRLTSVQARIKVWLYDWDISSIVDIRASRYLDSVLSATLTRYFQLP